MSQRFAEIAFTPQVKALQTELGSRDMYARLEKRDAPGDRLTEEEQAFIAQRDSFYLASVSETGWPYVQHRGGPAGFLKVIDPTTIAFADFRGNRQYVSVGNLLHDNRVALFLMDYPNQLRLKILGHARIVSADETALLERLRTPGYQARVERVLAIQVAAFDWNCPQHITPRFSSTEVEAIIAPLQARITELEQRLSGVKPAS